MTLAWAPRWPPFCRPAGLGLVAPKWLPLLDTLAALAPFAPKGKQGLCAGRRPPGARLALVVMAYVIGTSGGLPCLDLSAPREPAW